MPSKSKNDYRDLEKILDIECFRDSILSFFADIKDPRVVNRSTYRLEHIVFIILAAMLAAANSINQVAVFATVKAKWIKNLIKLDTIPTYGVFWWILVRLKPEFFRQLLGAWLDFIPKGLKDQILSIDGKCLRGTKNNTQTNPVLHLVSLFAVESGFILAQQPVGSKSNEITAIPEILEKIDLRGAIITIDAAGCQKNIARKICTEGADYVLALKGNAGLIHDEIVQYFKEAEEAGYEYLEHTYCLKQDKDHGRIVNRTIRCVQDIEWLPQREEWENLKGMVEVITERIENKKTSRERRYYITSLDADGERLGTIIQSHWAIENNLHRQLDVNFVEDSSPVNTGYAGENLATCRRIALNILGSGKGLLERRKKAAWDEEYLTELVSNFFIKSF